MIKVFARLAIVIANILCFCSCISFKTRESHFELSERATEVKKEMCIRVSTYKKDGDNVIKLLDKNKNDNFVLELEKMTGKKNVCNSIDSTSNNFITINYYKKDNFEILESFNYIAFLLTLGVVPIFEYTDVEIKYRKTSDIAPNNILNGEIWYRRHAILSILLGPIDLLIFIFNPSYFQNTELKQTVELLNR